jgi:hypothetical protein
MMLFVQSCVKHNSINPISTNINTGLDSSPLAFRAVDFGRVLSIKVYAMFSVVFPRKQLASVYDQGRGGLA